MTGTHDPGQPWFREADAGQRLAGKRAFVTGAGTAPGGELPGIGEAIAILFATQGAKVAIADISRERAEETLRLVQAAGGEGVAVVGDLTKLDENARCVLEAVDALGGLDTVVNSAALSGGGGSPVTVDLDVWDQVMAVNLHATFLTARHTIPHLQTAGGGSIINISSIAGARGHGAGAYAASKAGMQGLTRDWAYTHGRDNIRVNAILPGHVYTPMGNQGGPELRALRHRMSLVPLEGLAWDVAWPAVFLASEESRWVTGLEIPVDGGVTSTVGLAINLLNDRSPLS